MADVTFIVDGKTLTAPAGTLLIDACRKAGIDIPSFCYYPGLSLQAACRMCVVRQEKVPKLQIACTTTVAEGQVFVTDSPEITQARRATLELLLGNHPLDCPVCDKGGECELQNLTFQYGAGESLYAEAKSHREEQQWSPAVYYDRPRCILCYRCIRVCGEGMDVWALGVQNRGVGSVIAPNGSDHLDCEQCGMCIDICPVGALTSGSYRYKTRPWEMNHVSTICTHCADGCKVTLGVRQTNDGAEIVRANNRDKSGINGDFLCAKGRFGFDFVESAERLTKPLIRNAEGKLVEATWEAALRLAASKLKEVRDNKSGAAIGVIGSNHTTNEENYLLQKFARIVLRTNNIDHERSADYAAFAQALAGHKDKAASLRDTATAPAILLIGGNPTEEHPLLAWNLRTNVRLNRARLYVANEKAIKLERQAKATLRLPSNGYSALVANLDKSNSDFAKAVLDEESLLLVFGSEYCGQKLSELVAWGLKRGNVRFAYLGDYSNSRGAADMGLLPDLLPGYVPVAAPGAFAEYAGLPTTPGKTLSEMMESAANGELDALLVVGADPAAKARLYSAALKNTFVIVADLFLTETAARADVVFPAASLYEKTGTVTNTYGDVQLVKKAANRAGVKLEFEILVRLAGAMGVDVTTLISFGKNGPFNPMAILDEIARLVPSYAEDRVKLLSGNDVQTKPGFVPVAAIAGRGEFAPAHNGLFSSGTLGEHSLALKELKKHQARFGGLKVLSNKEAEEQ
jgi:NADH-quinone oxidoreductase subunit G